ncbi:hypothetical protein TRVL_00106 [Trypanosoma vivax]|nr:hypothetical protein TRVL_00106 [Trypanosoma vivax]
MCTLLLNEVCERLPFRQARLVCIEDQQVVVSSGADGVSAFVPITVAEGNTFTSLTLRTISSVLAQIEAPDNLECFLAFIDTGGSFSFYKVTLLGSRGIGEPPPT